jgi:hypothetical protein
LTLKEGALPSLSLKAARMTDPLGAFVPGVDLRLPGRAGGPLDGLTFAAKDLFDVRGFITGCGNPDGQQPMRPPNVQQQPSRPC